ncbi:hypothetical protein L218DRAFT_420523 [Marasmius fiardii PR-910]|nr:hypothetical protein L218DRAFT_420523 [Marasmius fiardii PR-910]
MLNSEHILQVLDLIRLAPSSFIYIHDLLCSPITSSYIDRALSGITNELTPHIHHVVVNGVACFSSRILYDSVINGLLRWNYEWSEGCSNWSADDRQEKYNDSMDNFVHGLRAVSSYLRHEHENEDVRLVLIIEKPERIKDRMPEVLVPLTRLGELSRVDLTVVFISEIRWEEIRPPLGASLDPFYVDVPIPSKETTVQYLCNTFLAPYSTSEYSQLEIHAYSSKLELIYRHFISVLYDSCDPFIKDPHEIQYIASARWPGFIKPVLDDFQRKVEQATMIGEPPPEFILPSEDFRMRLTRAFKPSFKNAMEALHPRTMNAVDWREANEPKEEMLEKLLQTQGLASPTRRGYEEDSNLMAINKGKENEGEAGIETLPRMSKFILLASFIASNNPAKTDLRMFGRGLDEKKRKRRVVQSKAHVKASGGSVKIPQHLVGPSPFPLDRMLAILGALLENNDAETRLPAPQFTIPGEHTDMEISRIGTYASVNELISLHLLHRTSATDKIDGPPMFRCDISLNIALSLAKRLGVTLNELLWDPL